MTDDSRLELKSFMVQVEQMRMAQIRHADLQANPHEGETENALRQITEIKRHLEIVVDDSVKQFRLANEYTRISPEQVKADNDFKTSLEQNLRAWERELKQVQEEIIDQALIDVKEGQRSARYQALEKRESDLRQNIAEAQVKLESVEVRVVSNSVKATIMDIINQAKPE
jgi:hypothetical protein